MTARSVQSCVKAGLQGPERPVSDKTPGLTLNNDETKHDCNYLTKHDWATSRKQTSDLLILPGI